MSDDIRYENHIGPMQVDTNVYEYRLMPGPNVSGSEDGEENTKWGSWRVVAFNLDDEEMYTVVTMYGGASAACARRLADSFNADLPSQKLRRAILGDSEEMDMG